MKNLLEKRSVRIAVYVTQFSVLFLLFAYWTFPYHRLRDYIVEQVERPMGPGGTRRLSGIELEIGELRPSWLTGATLKDVAFRKAAAPGEDPIEIEADEVNVRASVLSALAGNIGLTFDAEVGAGTIEGSYSDDEETTEISAELDSVDLRKLGVLKTLTGLPAAGKISGKADLTLSADVQKTKGEVSLDIAKLRLGDGEAKLKLPNMGDGLTIERIDAGDVKVRLEVENGVAQVKKLEGDGPDLELRGGGSVRLVRPASMSRLDLMVRVKFTDTYRNKSDRTRTLFSLFDMPMLGAAKTPDGALQYRVNGSIGGRISSSPAGRGRMPGLTPEP